MINNVVLVGRMTRDAELRYTPSNQAVATFSLAVNRNFKNQAGEREADFINCVIWRQQAENLANWAKKGALVGITGRIQTRNYFAGNILLHPGYKHLDDANKYPLSNKALSHVFILGCPPFWNDKVFNYIEDVLKSWKQK